MHDPIALRRPATYWGLLVGLVAAVVVPAYLWSQFPAAIDESVAAAVIALLIYGGVHLGALAGASYPRPLALTFWAFVYIWMALAPAAQMITGFGPAVVASNIPGATRDVSLIVLASAVVYDLAGLFRAKPPREDSEQRQISITRLRWITVIAVFAAFYYAHKVGFGSLFTSREAVAQATSSSDGQSGAALVSGAGQAMPFIALLGWTAVVWRKRAVGEVRPALSVLCWLAMLAVNVAVNNPIGNSRQWAGTVLIGFVLSRRSFGVKAFRIAVPLVVSALSVLFPYLDYFRQTDNPAAVNVTNGNGFDVLYAMSVKDYDASTQFVNAHSYVQALGYDFGHQLLGVVLFFVPRSAWPGKAQDTGVLLGTWIDSRANLNLSAPLWAEMYLAFGIPAVLVCFFLLGRWSRGLDRAFGAAGQVRNSLSLTTMLVPTLAGYQLIVLRGSLLQATGRLVILLVMFWLLCPRLRRPVQSEVPESAERMATSSARAATTLATTSSKSGAPTLSC